VRELDERNRAQLLGELQEEGSVLKGTPGEGDDKLVKDASVLQWKTTVERLENTPPTGRLVIHISKDVKRWPIPRPISKCGRATKSTFRKNQARNGGRRGISFDRGRVQAGEKHRMVSAAGRWSNEYSQPEAIFVVRADGSVAGGTGGMFTGGVKRRNCSRRYGGGAGKGF